MKVKKIGSKRENRNIIKETKSYTDKYTMITYILLEEYLHLAKHLHGISNGRINFGFYSQSVEGTTEPDGMIYLLHDDMQQSSKRVFFTDIYEVCQKTLSKQELDRLVISYDVCEVIKKIYY